MKLTLVLLLLASTGFAQQTIHPQKWMRNKIPSCSGTNALSFNATTGVFTCVATTATLAGDVDGASGSNDLDEVATEAEIESVVDLQDLQGAVTDTQVPNTLTLNVSQVSNTKSLSDNVKAAFVKIDVAAGSYEGGTIDYTLYCADASDRVTRSGNVPFSAQNTSSTETCSVGTATSSGDSTNNAKAFTTAPFTCADGGTNQIQIEMQADCTIATPTTLTIEYRVNLTSGTGTVTPQ